MAKREACIKYVLYLFTGANNFKTQSWENEIMRTSVGFICKFQDVSVHWLPWKHINNQNYSFWPNYPRAFSE